MKRAIEIMDCTILAGHRGQAEQDALFAAGRSQLKFPSSKHNSTPSKAVDVAPYPIDWGNRDRFNLFAGIVLGVASEKKIGIRWGGDWDGDTDTRDNRFDDLVHFELRD
mgnify:CR=1 FL=1